jgi:predicted Zn finger-like uncharacterized protein
MIVVCPSCSARFQYDEARFQGARSKRFRCPKCAHVFEAENPSYAPSPTTVFNAEAFAAKQNHPPQPAPAAPVPPPPYVPPETEPAGQETAARHDREAMLAAAGLRSVPEGIRVSLAYLSGPQASTVKMLDSYRTVIGREEGDVVTRDPETSRRHATLDIQTDGSVWLTDLGSTNGTFVDGIQIFGTIQLVDRQEFTCGKSTFMLLIRREDSLHME